MDIERLVFIVGVSTMAWVCRAQHQVSTLDMHTSYKGDMQTLSVGYTTCPQPSSSSSSTSSTSCNGHNLSGIFDVTTICKLWQLKRRAHSLSL
jgi:hypothetical protein